MKRSVSAALFTPCTNCSTSAGDFGLPLLSNSRVQNGNPSSVSGMAWLPRVVGGRKRRSASDALDRPHEVHQAVALEVALAPRRRRALEEDPLHLLGTLDELAADREERGDGT